MNCLKELSRLLEEPIEYVNPLDSLETSTSLQTLDNGFIYTRYLAEVHIEAIRDAVRVQAHRLGLKEEEDTPFILLPRLFKVGVSSKVLEIGMELPSKELDNLIRGYDYPYLRLAWKRVFDNYRELVRGYNVELIKTRIEQIHYYLKNTTLAQTIRDLCADMEEIVNMEDVVRHLYDKDMGLVSIQSAISCSMSTLESIIEGGGELGAWSTDRLESILFCKPRVPKATVDDNI